MKLLSLAKTLFGIYESIGSIKYYQTRSKKWRYKVVDLDGNTLINPIKGFATLSDAEGSFAHVRAVIESLPQD